MLLVDVNILVYAHREESPRHSDYHAWVEGVVNGEEPYAASDFVINGFVRVVTNHRVFRTPTPLESALSFAGKIRNQPHTTLVSPGPRFWRIFTELAEKATAKGKLVPDAYLAAVTIEHGLELVTTDGDFARFPGLRWRHPLD